MGDWPDEVARASDFLLIHFNGTPVEDIPARIAALKKYGKPIVCNEDDKIGDESVQGRRGVRGERGFVGFDAGGGQSALSVHVPGGGG